MFLTTCGNRLAQLAQLAQAVFAHLETAKDNSFAPYTLAKVMAYAPHAWKGTPPSPFSPMAKPGWSADWPTRNPGKPVLGRNIVSVLRGVSQCEAV
jgi:hypothetical protein